MFPIIKPFSLMLMNCCHWQILFPFLLYNFNIMNEWTNIPVALKKKIKKNESRYFFPEQQINWFSTFLFLMQIIDLSNVILLFTKISLAQPILLLALAQSKIIPVNICLFKLLYFYCWLLGFICLYNNLSLALSVSLSVSLSHSLSRSLALSDVEN